VINQRQAFADPIRREIVQQDIVASEGAYVGDAAAHLAGANDTDRLYFRHQPCLGRRFANVDL
jgi:hypothetical protein